MLKKLLKKGELLLTDIESTETDTSNGSTATLGFFQEIELDSPDKKGILIEANTSMDQLKSLKSGFEFIGIQFNAFSDGRGFSLASQIRDQLNYEGDIRACGDLIPDQIASLFNCGFSSIELPSHVDETMISEFVMPFSESYQSHQQSPTPLYRRVER